MNKILFVIPAFKHGGTNKSLANTLSFLNNHFDIYIMALSHLGPYKELFYEEGKVLEEDNKLSFLYDSYDDSECKKNRYIHLSIIIIKKMFRKIFKLLIGKKGIDKILKSSIKKIEKMNFDTIIAMQEGEVTNFVSKISGKKVAWVRSDYEEYYRIVGEDESLIYEKYKSIICVSEYTKKVFVSKYPQFLNKCYGVHNMIDYKEIIQMSTKDICDKNLFKDKKFVMVSVGRLSRVKQFHLIPSIAKQLKEGGMKFAWYIIGDGKEKSTIHKLIEHCNVVDEVILLGARNNPYPYIKLSNLVVVTSLSEACPNIINEGKILHVPVLTTNFGSAKEFIDNGVNGVITNEQDIVRDIAKLIRDDMFYSLIKSNISNFIYLNDEIVDKILSIINS